MISFCFVSFFVYPVATLISLLLSFISNIFYEINSSDWAYNYEQPHFRKYIINIKYK